MTQIHSGDSAPPNLDAGPVLARARSEFGAGRHRECMTVLRRLLTGSPDIAEAWMLRGGSLAQVKRLGEAVAHFRRLEVLSPGETRHLKLYRDAAFDLRQFSYCASICRKMLVREPADQRSLQLFARINSVRDQNDIALRQIIRLQWLVPSSSFVASALARAYFVMDTFDLAETWCRRSLALGEPVAERWLDLARILRARENYIGSRHALDQAVALDPSFALFGRVLDVTVKPEHFRPSAP